MLVRSVAAKSASSIFYEEFNDVDIYIEDTALGYRKIFKELLKKALGQSLKIDQVFPLGNRDEVIETCRQNQESDGRRKVYIVDGDLHLLNGNSIDGVNGLFVLPRYCIENYLLNEEAITEIAYEEDGEKEVDEIKSSLDFNNWVNENEPHLLNLFVLYALCFKYIPEEQTIGHKVSKLCASNYGIVCPDKIKERSDALYEKLKTAIGEELAQKEMAIIVERIGHQDQKILKYVSGKDYLLPLIITRLQSFSKFPNKNIATKVRLAMRANVDELKVIEDYIMK